MSDRYYNNLFGVSFKLNKRRRKPTQDYAFPGYYFVTIVTAERAPIFGTLRDGLVQLNSLGKALERIIKNLPQYHSNIRVDRFIVMPDHVHMILQILPFEVQVFKKRRFGWVPKGSLPYVIRNLKGDVTRWSRRHDGPYHVWQSNYHDVIITQRKQLYAFRKYIELNPKLSRTHGLLPD